MSAPALSDDLRRAKRATRSLIAVKYGFAALGGALLICALFFAARTAIFLSAANRAAGTVVELRESISRKATTYAPVVEFGVSEKKIRVVSPFASSNPRFNVGESVTVFYDASNPHEAKIDEFMSLWGAATIVGILGSVFFSIGGGLIAAQSIARRRDEYLRTNGVPLSADFLRVELNRAYKVNGRYPYRIFAQGLNPFTAETQIFKSRNIFFDPSPYVGQKKFTVFVDRNDSKKYFVDIEFLKNVTGELSEASH